MLRANPISNWDAYYQEERYKVPVYIIDRLWAHYLKVLRRHLSSQKDLVVVELGGANSCICKQMMASFGVAEYHIVDNNMVGLNKMKEENPNIIVHQVDLLRDEPIEGLKEKADLVISAGLIEHFTPENTAHVVRVHSSVAKPGGLILISFPTPTFVYRTFRNFLEMIDRFPPLFERPIPTSEILPLLAQGGQCLEVYKIWSVGLTQLLTLTRSKRREGGSSEG